VTASTTPYNMTIGTSRVVPLQGEKLHPWHSECTADKQEPPAAAAAALGCHTAVAFTGKPDALALSPDIIVASPQPLAMPLSLAAPNANLSTAQQTAPQNTSYIAEPALLLHPTASSAGASKLLLVVSQQQAGVHTAPGARKFAATDVSISEGLRSGSLVRLDDSAAAPDSSAQGAGLAAAWQPSTPQHQCMITEEGKRHSFVSHVTCKQLSPPLQSKVPHGPYFAPLQCAASLDFWLLFIVFGIGAGCGLMLINNLGASSARKLARCDMSANKSLFVSS
jgi:hypothetical protein